MKSTAQRHILIAANTTWYVYNFRSRMITALLDKGYQVTVLSPEDEYGQRGSFRDTILNCPCFPTAVCLGCGEEEAVRRNGNFEF